MVQINNLELTIEQATPNFVRELRMGRKNWNFEKMIKYNSKMRREYDDLKILPEKIWYIKTKIRIKTWINQELGGDIRHALPDGVNIFKNPIPCILDEARRDMRNLYRHELSCPPELKRPHSDQMKTRGLYYIFGIDPQHKFDGKAYVQSKMPDKTFFSYEDTLPYLQPYPSLVKLCEGYANVLCTVLDISMDVFKQAVMLLFLR